MGEVTGLEAIAFFTEALRFSPLVVVFDLYGNKWDLVQYRAV